MFKITEIFKDDSPNFTDLVTKFINSVINSD